MKNEILDIAKKLYHNHLTPETATNLLLDLFSVVRRSEQFCECDGVQDLIAGTGECRKCGGQCTY